MPDGVPFQHPAADTAPGTFSDFVLHDVFDLDTNPGLYGFLSKYQLTKDVTIKPRISGATLMARTIPHISISGATR